MLHVCLLLYTLCAPALVTANEIFVSHGTSNRQHTNGQNVSLNFSFARYQKVNLNFVTAFNHLHSNSQENLFISGLGAGLGYQMLTHNRFALHLNLSVCLSYRSKRYFANIYAGSHLCFSDSIILLVRCKQIAFGVGYLHFSNANLFPPNPGLDLKPTFFLGIRQHT